MDKFGEIQESINTSEEALLEIVLPIFSSYRNNVLFQDTGTLDMLFVVSFLFLYIQM